MLMIHASHFAVGWEGDQPYVNSAIPSEPNDTDGRGVFVKLSDPVYRCGGKVFRATFHWIGSPQGRQEEKEEVMDVMLCLKGKCNVCDPHMSDVPRNRDVDGKPFVHASCVEFGAAHGSHTYNVFKPAAGLKNDYARQYPVTSVAEVVFHDGQLRDVLVCVPELCAFYRSVEGGKKAGKAVLLKGEKR